jgi:hypothetical protein
MDNPACLFERTLLLIIRESDYLPLARSCSLVFFAVFIRWFNGSPQTG